MRIDYLPVLEEALGSVITYEQGRIRSSHRQSRAFGQFGQLRLVQHSAIHEPGEFAAVFVGGLFETAFYASTEMTGDNDWLSQLISVPFVLEASGGEDLRSQLCALEQASIAQRCLLRSSETRDEAYADLYALAARAISSQVEDFPLWQQQIHTFYAQAFSKAVSSSSRSG